MRFDRVDRIAFRLTCRELGALLKLMDLPGLPEIPVTPREPDDETALSLCESGAVMGCGERTFVDATLSLVLRTAAESGRHLAAKSAEGRVVLYKSERMYVLAEAFGNVVTLEPLQSLEAAREPFHIAAEKLGSGPECLLVDFRAQDRRQGGAEALEALYDALT